MLAYIVWYRQQVLQALCFLFGKYVRVRVHVVKGLLKYSCSTVEDSTKVILGRYYLNNWCKHFLNHDSELRLGWGLFASFLM
jgi:hypothetical protein